MVWAYFSGRVNTMGQVWGQSRLIHLKGEKEEWGQVLIFARVLFHPGKEEAQWVMISV